MAGHGIEAALGGGKRALGPGLDQQPDVRGVEMIVDERRSRVGIDRDAAERQAFRARLADVVAIKVGGGEPNARCLLREHLRPDVERLTSFLEMSKFLSISNILFLRVSRVVARGASRSWVVPDAPARSVVPRGIASGRPGVQARRIA